MVYKEDLYYHLFNRGNDKKLIVRDSEDYEALLERIYKRLITTGDKMVAYVIMPNHFHFFIKCSGDGSIPELMRSFGVSYGYYFRNKYDYTGHVFQGRYRSVLVDNLAYQVYLTRYLHRNPIESGIIKDVKNLENYEWSSYPQYIGKKSASFPITSTKILDMFDFAYNSSILCRL